MHTLEGIIEAQLSRCDVVLKILKRRNKTALRKLKTSVAQGPVKLVFPNYKHHATRG